MRDLFRRDKPIRPVFQDPPAESRDQAEAIARIDQRLEAFRLIPRLRRTAGAREIVDDLLDERNNIRPGRPREVPVVPGRVERPAENYRENP